MTQNPSDHYWEEDIQHLEKIPELFQQQSKINTTPRHSKPTNLYLLPKIHKERLALRTMTSSYHSTAYELAKATIDTYIENSASFIEIFRRTKLEPSDKILSFDIYDLFTNIHLQETIDIIEKNPQEDDTYEVQRKGNNHNQTLLHIAPDHFDVSIDTVNMSVVNECISISAAFR